MYHQTGSSHVGSQHRPQRLWLAVLFGSQTQGIRNTQLEIYITRLLSFLNKPEVNLSHQPFKDLLVTSDMVETQGYVRDLIVASSNRPSPILFLVDDYDSNRSAYEHLQKSHGEDIYLFLTSGEELKAMVASNDFREARDWCDEFVTVYIGAQEKASTPPPIQSQPQQHVYKEDELLYDSDQSSGEEGYKSPENILKPSADNQQKSSANIYQYNYDFPGSYSQSYRGNPPPRNDYRQYTQNENGYIQERQNDYGNSQSQSRQYPQEIRHDYGHYQYNEPRRYPQEGQQQLKPPVQRPVSPDQKENCLPYQHLQTMLKDFEGYREDQKEHMARYLIQDSQFKTILFNRFNEPFSSLDRNEKLMELIVVSAEAAAQKVMESVETLLLGVADNKLIEKICAQIRREGDDSAITILKFMMRVFLKAFEAVPWQQRPRFNESWQELSSLLLIAPKSMWENNPGEKHWFERSAAKCRGEPDPDEIPKQPQNATFYDEKAVEPMWQKSESKEPPEDFRSMSYLPTKRDIINPEPPYLRRSIVEGQYKDAQHYLDIQFRLFREDLISPLRDGLYNHKQTSSSRYNRCAGDTSSDIVIFDVLQIHGLQSRNTSGENLRYLEIKVDDFLINASPRCLKFGQHVVLSSDHFVKDVHLAVITERIDTELQTMGRLGVRFFSEDGLETGKPYILVEPNSYLEMYVHVLKVMQTLDQFTPLPMERYLVYTKATSRLPKYLRMEDDEEDKEVEKRYMELFLKHCKQKSKDEDSGIQKLTKKKRTAIADERQKGSIMFRGRTYHVDRLEEELEIEDYDQSQRKALISALTSEMALIQGPPGTGKTFIGVEIVRAILENRNRFGIIEPILLVCYTNAALDQFLEKILDKVREDQKTRRYVHDGPIAVRLGTKSESAKLEREGIMKRNVVTEWKVRLAMDEEQKLGKTSKNKRTAAQLLGQATYVVSEQAQRNLFSYSCLSPVLPDNAKNEMITWSIGRLDTKREKLDMDEVMACWLLNKSLEEGPPVLLPPSDSSDEDENERRSKSSASISGDDENATLEQVFKSMNIKAAECQARSEASWNNRDEFDKMYEINETWDIVKSDESVMNKVRIFGDGVSKTLPGEFGSRMSRSVPLDSSIVQELYEARENILRATPLSEKDVQGIRSIYDLPKQRRWELFMYWSNQLRTIVKGQIPGLMSNYKAACDKVQDALMDMDAKVLSRSLIIGATTTGAAKFRVLLEKIGCRIVMIEEAAEVLEAHTFASLLPSIEHTVLIGDHQQLRPNPSVYELARSYRMDVSLFERLILNKTPYQTLEKQHRMHPEITSTIIRPHFYKMLKDAENVHEYPEVIGMNNRLFFWNHEEPESTGIDGTSFYNETEVEMIGGLLQYIFKQGYGKHEVTVIATYSAQVERLRQKMISLFGLNVDGKGTVAVETVDSFQGKENKIIVVSLVRSGGNTIGFLQTANRVTVSLTRAQHGMYVLGNISHLGEKSELWNSVLTSLFTANCSSNLLPIKCRPHGTVQKIEAPREFDEKSPDGGCIKVCGIELGCGRHKCPRRCHPIDDHEIYACKAECGRPCHNSGYNHPCKRTCFEDCGLCQEIVSVTLSCEHSVNVACHMSGRAVCDQQCETILSCNHRCAERCGREHTKFCHEEVAIDFPICGHVLITKCYQQGNLGLKCGSNCEETLSCGHTCQNSCGEECTIFCMTEVVRDLSCGHIKTASCSENISQIKCDIMQRRKLDCGHESCVPCHAGQNQAFCTAQCNSLLPCRHYCTRECGECYRQNKHQCPEPCKKYLSCGHQCRQKCGDPCGSCASGCLTSCSHQACGQMKMNRNDNDFVTYNRVCSQQCILCTKTCDNRCQHRACSRKCFEPCDIKPCERDCSKQLPCSHACLGLCGEECPPMCGTCNTEDYKRLLNQHRLSDKEFHHLMSIPRCGHIFPVTMLDLLLQQQKDGNEALHCPVCNTPINSIKRHAKYIKKLALDSYKVKEKARNRIVVESIVIQESKMMEKYWLDAAMRLQGKRNRSQDSLRALVYAIKDDIARDGVKPDLTFWRDAISCVNTLCQLTKEFLDCQLNQIVYPRQIRDPSNVWYWLNNLSQKPGSDVFIDKCNIYYAIQNALDKCRSEIELNRSLKLSGTFISSCRFQMVRVWETRSQALRLQIGDVSSKQARELIQYSVTFRDSKPGDDYYQAYLNFVQYVNDKLLKENGIPSIDKYRAIKLPEY